MMNITPLVIYAAAMVAYAWHFTERNPMVGRTATTLLIFAALAHTFVIGMLTMDVGHVPVAGATSAISTFVWLLALAYLYIELTTDERAMGVFILPLLVALQAIPALRPGVDGVYLEYQEFRATFLPQVWDNIPDPFEFLRELRLKARLPMGFWHSELRLSRYTVEKYE